MDKVEQYRQDLDRLLKLAPREADYPNLEAYREAVASWRHRAGPAIRTLQSLVSLHERESPAKET